MPLNYGPLEMATRHHYRLYDPIPRMSMYNDSQYIPSSGAIVDKNGGKEHAAWAMTESQAKTRVNEACLNRDMINEYLDSEIGKGFIDYALSRGGDLNRFKTIGAIKPDDPDHKVVAAAQQDLGALMLSDKFWTFTQHMVKEGLPLDYAAAASINHELVHLLFNEQDETGVERFLAEFYTLKAQQAEPGSEEQEVYLKMMENSIKREVMVEKVYRGKGKSIEDKVEEVPPAAYKRSKKEGTYSEKGKSKEYSMRFSEKIDDGEEVEESTEEGEPAEGESAD